MSCLLVVVLRGAWKVSELGELKLEVDVVEVLKPLVASSDRRPTVRNWPARVQKPHPALILVQFSRYRLELLAQAVVLTGRSRRFLLQLDDLGLQVLQVLLLALTERALSSAILSLALL